MNIPPIDATEHRERRDRVLAELKRRSSAVGLVLAGEASPHGVYHPEQGFVYLTGITSEPGAAVLFDADHPDPTRRCVLFLRPLSPELEAWDGYRDPIGEAMRKRHAFDYVARTTHLPRMLTHAVKMRKHVACLHPFSTYDAPVGPDLATFRKVLDRVPGVGIEDATELIPSMRAVKSRAELSIIEQAIAITAKGYESALELIRPGLRERDVQRAMERTWQDMGSSGAAYDTIVGTGLNSTVLHYRAGDAVVGEDDLLCIDAGCALHGYASDITRTYPAAGKFSKRQLDLYVMVLRAQAAAIKAIKPGAWMHEVDEAARAVFRKGGVEDRYLHGIGHQLGLEVHDASPTKPLEAGMVITIEPGLYLPDEKTGIRIEDDVLVTKTGSRVLSEQIEKEPDAIETRMASVRRGAGR